MQLCYLNQPRTHRILMNVFAARLELRPIHHQMIREASLPDRKLRPDLS